jgi:hypothetical protein
MRWEAVGELLRQTEAGAAGRVPYGGTDLSRAVQARRIADGGRAGRTGNYAAGRLEDGTIITGRSSGTAHAEQDVMSQAGSRRIVDMYSEREPCAGVCQDLVKNMNTSWSWNWNGVDREAITREIVQTVRGLFK